MTRKELKEQAKQNLHGNWKWAALSSIFAVALFIIGSWMTANDVTNNNERIIGDIISIIASFTFIGMSITFLHFNDKLGKGNKKPLQALFAVYNKKYFVPGLKVYFSRLIFIALWCLLLFIPGIIKEYSYSMAEFIMTDMIDSGKSMTFAQAITESKKINEWPQNGLLYLTFKFYWLAIFSMFAIRHWPYLVLSISLCN